MDMPGEPQESYYTYEEVNWGGLLVGRNELKRDLDVHCFLYYVQK